MSTRPRPLPTTPPDGSTRTATSGQTAAAAGVAVSVRRLTLSLLALDLILLGLDLNIRFRGWIDTREMRDLFDITLEGNLPSWVSSMQFVLIGMAAFLISRQHRCGGRGWRGTVWTAAALFFVYLGLDDAASIHERLGTLAQVAGGEAAADSRLRAILDLFPGYYWQLFVLPLFAAFGLAVTVTFATEFKHTPAIVAFLSGMGLFVVAIALDYLDARDDYTPLMALLEQNFAASQHLARALEEFLEMAGTVLILSALLHHGLALSTERPGGWTLHLRLTP